MALQSKPISKGSKIVNWGEMQDEKNKNDGNLWIWFGGLVTSFFPAWQFDNAYSEQEGNTAGLTSW